MSTILRVSAVQMAPELGAVEENRAQVLRLLDQAAPGAQLIVFPECAISGYNFPSLEAAREAAEPIPGPTSEAVVLACRRLGVHAVVGLLELAGDQVYNSAAPFTLGADSHNGQVTHCFDGQLDEWRVYSRALSEGEIRTLMLPPTQIPEADYQGFLPLLFRNAP